MAHLVIDVGLLQTLAKRTGTVTVQVRQNAGGTYLDMRTCKGHALDRYLVPFEGENGDINSMIEDILAVTEPPSPVEDLQWIYDNSTWPRSKDKEAKERVERVREALKIKEK